MDAVRRLLALLGLLAAPALAELSPRELAGAVARPAAATPMPATLAFTDQHGARRTLGAIAGGRPLLLLFADYTCRHVCAPGATLVAAALRDSGLRAEHDYSFAIVGLDPRDGPAQARDFAARTRAPAAYLVGGSETVAAATRALGYHAVYDGATDQFAHDTALYVFRSDGRLAALLPELGVRAETLRAALSGAAPPSSLTEQVARLCYGFAAAHGRFGRPIALGTQALALATVAALAFAVLRARRA